MTVPTIETMKRAAIEPPAIPAKTFLSIPCPGNGGGGGGWKFGRKVGEEEGCDIIGYATVGGGSYASIGKSSESSRGL